MNPADPLSSVASLTVAHEHDHPHAHAHAHAHSHTASSAAPAASGEVALVAPPSRASFYTQLLSKAQQQLDSSPSDDAVTLMANLAALLYHSYARSYAGSKERPAVNWAGFYLLRNCLVSSGPKLEGAQQVLLLGPFHGQPAVSLIQLGRGVCGTAASTRTTQCIADVQSHPNHIACDSLSRSELVVPIFAPPTADGQRRLVGVLDMDSSLLNFFSSEDARAMEQLVDALGRKADWSGLEPVIPVRIPESDTCSMNRH